MFVGSFLQRCRKENNVGGLGLSIPSCCALTCSNCRSFHQIIIHEEGATAVGRDRRKHRRKHSTKRKVMNLHWTPLLLALCVQKRNTYECIWPETTRKKYCARKTDRMWSRRCEKIQVAWTQLQNAFCTLPSVAPNNNSKWLGTERRFVRKHSSAKMRFRKKVLTGHLWVRRTVLTWHNCSSSRWPALLARSAPRR